MTLYYVFWILVVVIFIVCWYFVRHYLTDERNRQLEDAVKRIGSLIRKEVKQ